MSKIVDCRVIVCSPGRNFVTLKIIDSDGVVGWGDATLNGRELAVASYLTDHVIPTLIGKDAARINDIWQYLYKGAYWRRGPVTMTAIAAVDVALWDIKGKHAGMPVYELLGGLARTGALVYGHATGNDTAEMLDDVARFLDEGFLAVRAQSALAGGSTASGAGPALSASTSAAASVDLPAPGIPAIPRTRRVPGRTRPRARSASASRSAVRGPTFRQPRPGGRGTCRRPQRRTRRCRRSPRCAPRRRAPAPPRGAPAPGSDPRLPG